MYPLRNCLRSVFSQNLIWLEWNWWESQLCWFGAGFGCCSGFWYPIFAPYWFVSSKSSIYVNFHSPFECLAGALSEKPGQLHALGTALIFGVLHSYHSFEHPFLICCYYKSIYLICFESGLLNLVRACLLTQRYSRNLHLFGMINIHKALLWLQLFFW